MPESISAATNQVLTSGRKQYVWDGTNWQPQASNTAGHVILGAGTAAAGTVAVSNIETIQTELFAAASVAASAQVASTVLSVVGVKRATVFISHGRASSAAFGTNGTEYRVEVSEAATATNKWRPIASVLASSAVCMTAAASANVAVGATTVVILSGTAVTRGDILVWPSGTIEWMEVAVPTGTASFTTTNPLDFAHAAATATLVGGGQFLTMSVNVESATRMRVFINNLASGTTLAVYSKIACITQQ